MNAAVLDRYLAEIGAPRRLPAGLPAGTSPIERVLDALHAFGLPSHVVRTRAEALSSMALPALVEWDGGDIGLLLRWDASHATIDSGAGEQRITRSEFVERFSGSVIEVCPLVPDRRGLLRFLARVVAAHRGLLVRLGVTISVVAALGTLIPFLTRTAIDEALPSGADDTVATVVLCVFAVGAHLAWFTWLSRRCAIALNVRFERALAHAAFDRMLRFPLEESLSRSTGQRLEALLSAEWLVARLSYDSAAVLVDAAVASSSAAFLFFQSARIALVTAAVAIGLGLFGVSKGRQLAKFETAESNAMASHGDRALELLVGLQSIRVAAAEPWMLERWRGAFRAWLDARLSRQRTALSLSSVTDAIEGCAIAGLVLWLGKIATAGAAGPGELITALQCGVLVLTTGSRIGGRLATFWVAAPHVDRVRSIFGVEAEPPVQPQDLSALGDDAVVFDHVWFQYSPGPAWVLKDVSFCVRRGEIRELTSASGSGKTTILRLIAGLYRPTRGTVRIGGLAAELARDWVTYLPQTVHLFAGSVLDNLRRMSGGAPLERIEAAARLTGLDAIAAAWPSGYHTGVADRGDGISGGQQQLVALTAAIASERPLLLLDEATSSMDRSLRKRLADPELFRGKTLVSAVHDPFVRDDP
jgi:ABC-type bacteriocin/lantibiotic exporter with double-glycine peptidase domain